MPLHAGRDMLILALIASFVAGFVAGTVCVVLILHRALSGVGPKS